MKKRRLPLFAALVTAIGACAYRRQFGACVRLRQQGQRLSGDNTITWIGNGVYGRAT